MRFEIVFSQLVDKPMSNRRSVAATARVRPRSRCAFRPPTLPGDRDAAALAVARRRASKHRKARSITVPEPGGGTPGSRTTGLAERAVVVTVKVEVMVELPLGATAEGEKTHEASAGRPAVQLSNTEPVKPFEGVTLTT
jgi:hypothetical protein